MDITIDPLWERTQLDVSFSANQTNTYLHFHKNMSLKKFWVFIIIIIIIIENIDSLDYLSLSPSISIGHHSCWVFKMAPNVHTELMNVNFCYLVFLCNSYLAFSRHFVKVQVVQPDSSANTATTWKNPCYILSERSDFHMVVNLSIAIHTLALCLLISLTVYRIYTLIFLNGWQWALEAEKNWTHLFSKQK